MLMRWMVKSGWRLKTDLSSYLKRPAEGALVPAIPFVIHLHITGRHIQRHVSLFH